MALDVCPLLSQLTFLSHDRLLYFFALAGVCLLPVRRRWGSMGLSLALALIWGAVAENSCYFLSPPWWTYLALAEAALFLLGVLGAVGGKARFEASSGPWTLLGAALLGYSLLVFPLLGFRFDVFHGSVFEFPFPPVLFTCGVLFFVLQEWMIAVLLPLIAWALFGGPVAFQRLAETTGLQVALVAGTLFLMLPRELRGGGDGRSMQGNAYRLAYRYHVRFGYALWALIVGVGFLFFLLRIGPPLLYNLLLLCGLLIVLWLLFPAWHSRWYRYVAWSLAQCGGWLWVGLKGSLRWIVLLLGGAALFIALTRFIGSSSTDLTTLPTKTTGTKSNATTGKDGKIASATNTNTKVEDLKTTSTDDPKSLPLSLAQIAGNLPLQLFLASILIWAIYSIYQARKRLVIGDVAAHIGDGMDAKADAQKIQWVAGLGPRLQNKLARIADLYRVIDEARPSQSGPVIQVTPEVKEVGQILADASAIDFGFGPVKIPTKIFFSLLGRLVSGPRLACALNKVDTRYVLTAELSGGGLPSYNWRVDYDNLSETERDLPEQAAVHSMVEQLAYRIATDLVAIGSPRWRAVRQYTHGLRSYRDTERKHEKSGSLREAEYSLIQALSEDQKFTQCHYNLGVVYRQLGELGSAESAFRRALQQQPGHFHACYALAETLVEGKKYGDGLWFCESAICIAADDPRAWDLGAYARRYGKQKERNLKTTLPPADPIWKEVLEMSEIGTALAWRALCREALRGPSATLETRKLTAFLCARNLAVHLARGGLRYGDSLQVFRQAAWLSPYDTVLRLYEGRTLLWRRQWKEAAAALKGVFEDGLNDAEDRGLLWSSLAQTEAHSGSEKERDNTSRLAHDRFLDLVAGATSEELKELLGLGLEKPPSRRYL